ncbi:dipeptidyl-peptidase 4 [Thermotomaculum hydrothermale]|uniref:Dipeptidyl-peptidase 4 n=1 Tax=Thermotomaculum hydrothermale TaxID=981385 RepID=A0A7R6PE79_9BACT|nr:M14 family zinc carboxypeptidase [Thermotomaculum hydrothermale]BBB32073.1 dipeptidyl-peptidase 4 [Thermotomaculum hydrothermale]
MNIKRIVFSLILFFSFFCFAQEPLTIAEKSNFTSTSRVKDVVNFFLELEKEYPENIVVSSIGKTFEGREIPLVIVGNPAPLSPCETKKPVILINANIHAGEIEGKEAVQMYVRDMFLKKSPYLDKFVFLIVPVFNVDGNEKISPSHRPYQKVKNGVGIRYNGMNMDLNRDFVKLESREARALVRLFNRWHPLVFVDMHTTNGSFHEEPLTFTWCMSPHSSHSMIDFMKNEIYPFMRRFTRKNYNFDCIPYGHFDNQENPTKWNGFFGGMVFATGYFGVKGAFSFLDENYAYADYKTRVKAAYAFLDGIFTFMADEENLKEMRKLQEEYYKRDFAYIYKNVKPEPCGDKVKIKGYRVKRDEKTKRFKPDKTKRIDYNVDFVGCFNGERVDLKGAFVFPAGLSPIAKKLMEHGIKVFKIAEDTEVNVRKYKIDEISFSDFPFQGRQFVKEMKGHFETSKEKIEKGYYIVPLGKNQIFRQVAAALLYPESEDSLLKEGFFNLLIFPNQWSKKPGYYPVYLIDSVKGIKLRLVEKCLKK